VTTYVGAAAKAVKVPGKAAKYVAGKLGKASRGAEHVAEDISKDASRGADKAGSAAEHAAGEAGKDARKTEKRASDVVTVAGYAQHPRMYPWLKNPDGAVRTLDEAVEIARAMASRFPTTSCSRR